MDIEYVCFLNQSGYSQAAQDLIFPLYDTGKYDFKLSLLHTLPLLSALTKERAAIAKKMANNTFEAEVQVYHCIPEMQQRFRRLKKTVGFATFETFEPPPHWVKILNSNNAVIVPSLFNKLVFETAGVTSPIYHIPHCVDTKIWHPEVKTQKDSDAFTFMFFGTWKKRKGWEQLIEAWINEFSKSDNVRLVIKTDKIHVAKEEIHTLRKKLGLTMKESAPILFESKIFNELELPSFMKKADCLISPTLGEGFGLPGLQCMALEVPVIITDFSGCQDYATEETATLLKPSGFTIKSSMDQIPQFKNRRWCHINIATIRSAMRYVLENRSIVQSKAKYAAQFVSDNFNSSVAVSRFDNMISELK